MGGDQDRYLELKDQIYDFIEHIKDIKFNLEDFERIKKKNIGNFINVYNSPEAIANLFSRYYFEGIISLDIVDIISTIQLEDIYSVMKYFDLKYTSTFIVKK